MSSRILSPFSFYGGKARLAYQIADMLDYQNTDLYVEPFGGACRVLLNKPRHDKEIYNELGTGLVAFFEELSRKETADQVIRKLYDMDISSQVFIDQQRIRNETEMDIVGYITKQTLELLRKLRKKYENNNGDIKKLFLQTRKALTGHEYPQTVPCLEKIMDIIDDKKDKERVGEYRDLFSKYWKFIREEYSNNYVHQLMFRIDNGRLDAFSESEMDIRFNCLMAMVSGAQNSPGASGNTAWETGGYKFDKERQEAIDGLLEKAGGIEKIIELSTAIGWHRDIHEEVLDNLPENGKGIDEYNKMDLAVATFYTYTFSRDGRGMDFSDAKGNNREAYYRKLRSLYDIADRLKGVAFMETDAIYLIETYRRDSRVMMYLDPSYLNDNDKDLGKGKYAESFNVKDHERLLERITRSDTEAKILVSNYSNDLYNSYLTEENGWKKIEIETKTTVGSKRDNKRTEVLWYNY